MATAKETKLRTERTAKRLDWLHDNARVLRSPALWSGEFEISLWRMVRCFLK